MVKNILILISAIALGTSVAIAQVGAIDPNRPAHKQDDGRKAQKYTCVMHPDVVMSHPGDCPKCGMKLVPMKEEKKHSSSKIEHPTSNAENHTGHAGRDSHRHDMPM